MSFNKQALENKISRIIIRDNSTFWNNFCFGKRYEAYIIVNDDVDLSSLSIENVLNPIVDANIICVPCTDSIRQTIASFLNPAPLLFFNVWNKSIWEQFSGSPDFCIQLNRCILGGIEYGNERAIPWMIKRVSLYDFIFSTPEGLLTYEQIFRETLTNGVNNPSEHSAINEYLCLSVMRNFLLYYYISADEKNNIIKNCVEASPQFARILNEPDLNFSETKCAFNFIRNVRQMFTPQFISL